MNSDSGHPLVVHRLGKRLRRYHSNRPSTLKETLFSGLTRLRAIDQFWVLRDVSLNVPAGHVLGIIGANGAGKSTLLRLLGGVGLPDEGSVHTSGRVGALLDLEAGFHPELSGRENLVISGLIAGLTRSEIAERTDAIVEFAELAPFIDSPLRTYSSGMRLRLGFAVAVHVNPHVLLIDEVLAVGDVSFQAKCLARIDQIRRSGSAIVIVSHDLEQIRKTCNEVLWLQSGQVAALGDPGQVIDAYISNMSHTTHLRTPASRPDVHVQGGKILRLRENRFGSMEVEIVKVQLLTELGEPVSEILSGDPLVIEITCSVREKADKAIFGVTMRRDDVICCDMNMTKPIELEACNENIVIRLHIGDVALTSGDYDIDVGVYEATWSHAYDYHWKAYTLTVRSPVMSAGLFHLSYRWLT